MGLQKCVTGEVGKPFTTFPPPGMQAWTCMGLLCSPLYRLGTLRTLQVGIKGKARSWLSSLCQSAAARRSGYWGLGKDTAEPPSGIAGIGRTQ